MTAVKMKHSKNPEVKNMNDDANTVDVCTVLLDTVSAAKVAQL